jgi:hypothetical protein
MADFISNNQDLFDLLIKILVILIPAALTWFVRTYVNSAKSEKTLAGIVQLANIAIDYAEDLDKRGDLEKYLDIWGVPDDVKSEASAGIQKLNVAGKWLESQLKELGIEMTDKEAQSWIASEFRKRVGDTGKERRIAELTQEAVDLLQALQGQGVISLSTELDQAVLLADNVAAWVIGQLGDDSELARAEALVRARTALMTDSRLSGFAGELSMETRLADLANRSVQYVQDLKRDQDLTLPEVDIAVAWMLTEVTKKGLDANGDQIASAVQSAFKQRGAEG